MVEYADDIIPLDRLQPARIVSKYTVGRGESFAIRDEDGNILYIIEKRAGIYVLNFRVGSMAYSSVGDASPTEFRFKNPDGTLQSEIQYSLRRHEYSVYDAQERRQASIRSKYRRGARPVLGVFPIAEDRMYDKDGAELARAQYDVFERYLVIHNSEGVIIGQNYGMNSPVNMSDSAVELSQPCEDSYMLNLTEAWVSDPFLIFCFAAVLDHAIIRENARRAAIGTDQ